MQNNQMSNHFEVDPGLAPNRPVLSSSDQPLSPMVRTVYQEPTRDRPTQLPSEQSQPPMTRNAYQEQVVDQLTRMASEQSSTPTIRAAYPEPIPDRPSRPGNEPSQPSTTRTMYPSLVRGLNVMAEGTYPRATRLHDGSILGVHTAFRDDGVNIIAVVKSRDNGVTWTTVGEVTRGIGDIDNPFVVQLPSGRILCAFRNHSKNANGEYTCFRITLCCSDDDGAKWSYLSTADQNDNPVTGLWEPFMRIANDGSLQLYYSRENAGNDQNSIQRISHDNGETWSEAVTISGGGIVSRDGMLGIAPFEDGLIAVFETNDSGTFTIKSVSSTDDGMTWENRQLIYEAVNGKNATAPQVTNCGGALMVTFMTDEDGHAFAVKMIVGSGPGRMGEKMVVGHVQSSWAGILTLDDSNVLVMMDQEGCKSQIVTLNRP